MRRILLALGVLIAVVGFGVTRYAVCELSAYGSGWEVAELRVKAWREGGNAMTRESGVPLRNIYAIGWSLLALGLGAVTGAAFGRPRSAHRESV